MRIVIDLQGAQSASRFRGIGRFSLNFAKAVVRNRGEHEVILALSGLFPDTIEPIRAAFDGLLPQENIRVWYAPGPVREHQPGNDTRRRTAELIREAFLASLKPDIIHICSLFEGYWDDAVTSIGRFDKDTLVSVTLYDLIPLLNPKQYLKPNPDYERHYIRKIACFKRASLYLAISESSRQEAISALGIPPNKIVNVSVGADERFKPVAIGEAQRQYLQERFGINRPFIMYAGAIEPRKNVEGLIRAYAKLDQKLRKAYQLVIVCQAQQADKERLIALGAKMGLQDGDLVLTSYIPDDDLVAFYNACTLFVFPSWHEGFGLPVLEAMSCGKAAIAANTSSLPEIVGDPDALFDPKDDLAICNKITQVLRDDSFRRRLEQHGLIQAKKFGWDRTALRAITAMEDCHKQRLVTGPIQPTEHIAEFCRCSRAELPSLLEELASTQIPEVELAPIAVCLAQNFPPSPRCQQLLVDISELVQRDTKTGIQRVVRSILKEWLTNPPDGYRVEPVYATLAHGYRYARRFTQSFMGLSVEALHDDYIDYAPGDIFFGLDLQPLVQTAQRDFFQVLRRHGVQVKFLVYDLLCVLMPQCFPPVPASAFARWLEVVSESDGAVCISKAVADELSNWIKQYGFLRERPFTVGWFHLGADVDDSVPSKGLPNDADRVLARLTSRHTFLMVGTLELRKAHAQVLNAFEQLWSLGVEANLVIVGKQGWQGWMVEELVARLRNHPELNKRLFWLESISDEYLEKVYAASTCLIAASYGEGFGLPLVEAAQHKLPIIARDIPVFREVAKEHAFYFANDKFPDVIANAIKDWLELYKQNKHPKSDAMPHLTWKQSAKNLLDIILEDKWEYKIKPDGLVRPGVVYDHRANRIGWQKGWSWPEKDFRWSDGDDAIIEFCVSAQDVIRCRGIRLKFDTLGRQRISIGINGRKMFDGVMDGLNQELLFQSVDFHEGVNRLAFSLPDARQPGNGDGRKLALAIKEFEIRSRMKNR